MNHEAELKRLKGVLKDSKICLDMNQFLDKLSKRNLISTPPEMDLKEMAYDEQIDRIFGILTATNEWTTYGSVLDILKEMNRDDIAKLPQPTGKNLNKVLLLIR